MALIGPAVSEVFEHCGRQRRTTEHGDTISSPCEHNDSGELISKTKSSKVIFHSAKILLKIHFFDVIGTCFCQSLIKSSFHFHIPDAYWPLSFECFLRFKEVVIRKYLFPNFLEMFIETTLSCDIKVPRVYLKCDYVYDPITMLAHSITLKYCSFI